jgi:hypothetical protein
MRLTPHNTPDATSQMLTGRSCKGLGKIEYMVRYTFASETCNVPLNLQKPLMNFVSERGPLGLLDLERTARRVYRLVVGHMTVEA